MGKRGKSSKKYMINPMRRHRDDNAVDPENVDDEIDVYENDEHPVFDLQDIDDEEENEDEEGDDDDIDDVQVFKFAAKIARQHKLLSTKFGGVEDEMDEEEEEEEDEDEKEEMAPWGGKKSRYYGGDNCDFELHSSDDEAPMEEEDEVKEIRKERAKYLSIEDFGLEDASEDDTNRELTLEEISAKGKGRKLSLFSEEAVDDMATFEEVKKDLNALSKEEQMDVVHSSAPELIGLLSELNDALEELDSKVNPLLRKPEDTPTLQKMESASKVVKFKFENDQVGVQSREMLKVRAALDEELKQKGIFSSNIQKLDKTKKHVKPVNGQLETYDDFADDAMDAEEGACGLSNGHASSQHSNKISQLITAKRNKSKVVSGNDDLPKRDDIGERLRKHELRVLAGAAVKSEDDHEGDYDTFEDDGGISVEENGDTEDTEDAEDEFYKQVKQQRAAKLAAKAEIYTRTSASPSLPKTIDGKRQITYQIEKNRGLTRPQNKNTKNPRKKYRLQSKKREKQRKGQVRDIRKPVGQ